MRGEKPEAPKETPVPTPTPTPTLTSTPFPITSPTNTISQTELNKIKELEDKINSMQQQITDLQIRVDRVGLPKPSNKSIIPQVPFTLEVQIAELRTPLTYVFKDGGVEIREEGAKEFASYIMYRNNNTIKIISEKYDFYGLVLYEDYVTAIYENGWIAWARKYRIYRG